MKPLSLGGGFSKQRWVAWGRATALATTLAMGACGGDNAPQTPEDALPDAPTALCETDNGGCDTLTTCSEDGGVVTCGDCPTGYSGTGADGCDDIDECDTNNGGCEQVCNNEPGQVSNFV